MHKFIKNFKHGTLVLPKNTRVQQKPLYFMKRLFQCIHKYVKTKYILLELLKLPCYFL